MRAGHCICGALLGFGLIASALAQQPGDGPVLENRFVRRVFALQNGGWRTTAISRADGADLGLLASLWNCNTARCRLRHVWQSRSSDVNTAWAD